MIAGKPYVLDANVFIEAQQKYYAFDLCPGFWTELIRLHRMKRVCSIDRVLTEIEMGNDRLRQWSRKKASEGFFKRTADQDVGDWFAKMVRWVQNEQQFTSEAKAQFASVADGWVMAYARTNGSVVVTHEVYAPEVKRQVPMPNVCIKFNIDYCNLFEMLRHLKVTFGAKKRASRR